MTKTNTPLKHCGKIKAKVQNGIMSGLSVKMIFESIQSHQYAPKSLTTFYKLYGEDMAEARAEIVGKVGKKVIDQAVAGDFKSQELYLRSRGDWSPQHTEVQVTEESTDEAVSAVNQLMAALGKLDELQEAESEE